MNKNSVVMVSELAADVLPTLLSRYDMHIVSVENGQNIPGSFWGDEEAGIIDNRLYVRPDTPLHSALHEACHYICMDRQRRDGLHTDAGGDYDEENAVCYLQILLADQIPGIGAAKLMQDMDSWGYSFRLGSARAWFDQDAEDARAWLLQENLVDQAGKPTWQLRQ